MGWDKQLHAFLKAKRASEKYSEAIESGDSNAAVEARKDIIDNVNKTAKPQKVYNRFFGNLDKDYKDKFGVDGGTIKYNDEKGEASIESGDSPVPSEKNGGGTFLTAGAGMDGNTMLTKGYLKKNKLGAV